MKAKLLLDKLRTRLRIAAIPEKAAGMQAYMKSAMPYWGVQSTPLREICREEFAGLAFAGDAEWHALTREFWNAATHREEWTCMLFLAGHKSTRNFQTPAAMPLYEELIVAGAWWDIVDDIATHRVAGILRMHPAPLKKLMRKWSKSENMWIARTSIICQSHFRDATDVDLLFACIEPSIGSKELFLRKAIGWALRELGKSNPRVVEQFVRRHEDRLAGLSKREALKYV